MPASSVAREEKKTLVRVRKLNSKEVEVRADELRYWSQQVAWIRPSVIGAAERSAQHPHAYLINGDRANLVEVLGPQRVVDDIPAGTHDRVGIAAPGVPVDDPARPRFVQVPREVAAGIIGLLAAFMNFLSEDTKDGAA